MSEDQKKYLLIIVALVVGGILLWAGTAIALPKYDLEFRLSLIITGSVVLLVTFVVMVVQFCYPKVRQNSSITPEGSAVAASDQIEWKTLRSVVVGAGALVMLTFGWAGTYILWKGGESEIALPIVIIAGVTVLLLVLGLLTFVFSMLKLSDSKEALGLPSGSVRAVIALMLLVIFAIVAIFLYSDVASSGMIRTLSGVSSSQLEQLKKSSQFEFISSIEEPSTAAEQKEKRFTAYYRNSISVAGQDLAKQLIILLGTLVTAVSSFYFGSNSIAAAKKVVESTGGPNAKAVTPSNLAAGGEAQPLKITGSNLGNVTSVKLVRDNEIIVADADVVGASETSVDCKIETKTDTSFGPWTVVVSDNANNDSRIPKSVTIGTKPKGPAQVASEPAPKPAPAQEGSQVTTKPATAPEGSEVAPKPAQGSSGTAGEPKPEKIDPPKLQRGVNAQPFKIVGSALKDVDGVKLTLAGQNDITAVDKSVTAIGTEVNCKMTTKADAAAGPWDVVLMKGTMAIARLPGAVTIGP